MPKTLFPQHTAQDACYEVTRSPPQAFVSSELTSGVFYHPVQSTQPHKGAVWTATNVKRSVFPAATPSHITDAPSSISFKSLSKASGLLSLAWAIHPACEQRPLLYRPVYRPIKIKFKSSQQPLLPHKLYSHSLWHYAIPMLFLACRSSLLYISLQPMLFKLFWVSSITNSDQSKFT